MDMIVELLKRHDKKYVKELDIYSFSSLPEDNPWTTVHTLTKSINALVHYGKDALITI